MNRTLIEKVGENRNVKKVLEVMTEKYSRTKGEKMLEVMKNISGFKTDEKVKVLMDRIYGKGSRWIRTGNKSEVCIVIAVCG